VRYLLPSSSFPILPCFTVHTLVLTCDCAPLQCPLDARWEMDFHTPSIRGSTPMVAGAVGLSGRRRCDDSKRSRYSTQDLRMFPVTCFWFWFLYRNRQFPHLYITLVSFLHDLRPRTGCFIFTFMALIPHPLTSISLSISWYLASVLYSPSALRYASYLPHHQIWIY
jgi:hypothetical protein